MLLIPIFLLTLLVCSLGWFIRDWHVSIITAIYQLKTPLEGTNPGLILEFCAKCLPIPIIATIGFGLYLGRAKRLCPVAVFFACIIILLAVEFHTVGLARYLMAINTKGDLFDNNYVNLNLKDVSVANNGKPKNLILIYCESMETTYASRQAGGGKPENLIPGLTRLASENISFSNTDKLGGAYSMPGTDWTMGGIFSTMTGTPLKLDLGTGVVDLDNSFCPNVVAIGDVLKNQGYTNYFQCGSDATFGGRSAFFTEHGDYEIKDLQYARDMGYIPEDYQVFWGYEDAKLFSIAKNELTEIAEKNESFNYTMLTVDTHHPAGYKCELCTDEFDSEFANIIACSDRQICEFVEWIQSQEWYENTTIVLLGDHPSMVAGFWDDTMGYENRAYNCFINTVQGLDANYQKDRKFTHFDITPTILESIGFKIKNRRMGLGVSLYSDSPTLAQTLGPEELRNKLCEKSSYYVNNILN